MAHNAITISATPDQVFDVLDDACAYPSWVVGARRVRHVEPDWPAVGSRFHHALGVPGGELRDNSLVLERRRPELLVLEVRFRPTGVARVRITVDSGPHGADVELDETIVSGALRRLPTVAADALLGARNAWSLRRLRRAVERRAALLRGA